MKTINIKEARDFESTNVHIVSDETCEKIEALIETDKKKEKPKFEPIEVCHLTVSISDFDKNFIRIEMDKNADLNGQRCSQEPAKAKQLIKALQSAIDHVEANK